MFNRLDATARMHLITDTLKVNDNSGTFTYTSNAYFTESDSVFRNNKATDLSKHVESGSCYYGTAASEAKFINTIFESNAASAKGGAIYISVVQTYVYC